MDELSAEQLYQFVARQEGAESDLAQTIKSKEIDGNVFYNYNELQWRCLVNAKTLKQLWPQIQRVKENYNKRQLGTTATHKKLMRPPPNQFDQQQNQWPSTQDHGEDDVEENAYGNVTNPSSRMPPPLVPPRHMTKPNETVRSEQSVAQKLILPPRNPGMIRKKMEMLPIPINAEKDVAPKRQQFPLPSETVEDEIIEYADINEESDVDDEGYLLPSETTDDCEKVTMHRANSEINIKEKLLSLLNRPLPSIPPSTGLPLQQQSHNVAKLPKNQEVTKFFTLPSPPRKIVRPSIPDFCPLEKYVPGPKSLTYYRNTDRKGAALLLNQLDEGAFLLRPSKTYDYTLNIKYTSRILHVGVINESDTWQLLVSDGHEPNVFNSLEEMIEFYMDNPIHVRIDGEVHSVYIKNLLPSHMH